MIDDGAGNCAWGEFQDAIGSGSYFTILTGSSNFAQGATYGTPDMSGVTFASGSRVYLMTKIGTINVGNNTRQIDNNSGIIAATNGSPLFARMLSGTGDNVGSGVSLFGITVKYE